MEKILNPLRLLSKEDIKSLPVVEYNGFKFRKWVKDETYINKYKGCQCFGDCSCPDDDGKVMGSINTYYRRIEFDDTDKAFYDDINYIPVQLRK